MPNDDSLTLQKTRPDSGPPPPPYTDEYPARLPNNLVLSRLAEDSIQQINPVSFAAVCHFFFLLCF